MGEHVTGRNKGNCLHSKYFTHQSAFPPFYLISWVKKYILYFYCDSEAKADGTDFKMNSVGKKKGGKLEAVNSILSADGWSSYLTCANM